MAKTVTTVKFDDSAFTPFLSQYGPYAPDTYVDFGSETFSEIYNSLVQSGSLPEAIVQNLAEPAATLSVLATMANPDGAIDETGLLTVKTDEEGLVSRVYGPGLFSDGAGGIVLRIGKNILPATHKGTTVTVGELSGRLRFSVVQAGDEERLRVVLPLKHSVQPETVYECAVLLAAGIDCTQADIEDGLDAGEPLCAYLRPATGGGGKFIKLGDLDQGDHAIAGVVESDKPEYGRFRFELADGRIVNLNTYLKTQVEGLAAAGMSAEKLSGFYAGKKLRVLSKEIKGNRCFVKCQIITDAPLQLGAAKLASTPKLPAAKPAAAAKRTPTIKKTVKVAGDSYANNPF